MSELHAETESGRTTSYVRWRMTNVRDQTFTVVRVTETVEPLAGPFKTIAAASKWMAEHGGQSATLFDGDGDE